MILDDSKQVLEEANEILDLIEQMYYQSLKQHEIHPKLSVKIKSFFDHSRSALEYPANYIFETYCSVNFTEKELSRKKPYFPIRKTKNAFDNNMKELFKGLSDVRPDIVNVFEKHQPFNEGRWLLRLNLLSNDNKHKYLSGQKKKRKTKTLSRIQFENCTFIGNGTDIMIDGVGINFNQSGPINATIIRTVIWDEIVFSGLDIQVLSSLKEIYSGTCSVIKDLAEIL